MSGVWTRNYTNMLAGALGGGGVEPSTGSANYSNNNLSLHQRDNGYTRYVYSAWTYFQKFPQLQNVGYGNANADQPRLLFGTGTTAPTYDDWKLETPNTNFTLSQNNITVDSYGYNATNHSYYSTRRFVVQYTGSAEITITEFGLFCYSSLMYREVFDTPITLNQYESVVLEFTQEFPLVNYEPYPT